MKCNNKELIMLISTIGKTIYATMIVVNTESTYNAILRRPWLNEIWALLSIFHQTIKFLNSNKVDVIMSEQKAA